MIFELQHIVCGDMGPRLRGGDKPVLWRRVLWLAAVLAALLAQSSTAAAHAVLLGSEPPHRAVLAAAPHHVVLRFNEPVTPIFVRLVDAAGRERALPRAAHAVNTDVHAHLPPGLEAGTYVVSFRVMSADGHPVGGALLFSIGSAGDGRGTATTDSTGAGWRIAAIANRAIQIVCLFLACGGLLFAGLVQRRKLHTAARSALAGVAAVTAIVGVILQGAALTGGLPLLTASFWHVTLATPQAISAAATLAALAFAFVLAPRLERRRAPMVAVACAALALMAAGITGHSAAAGWIWWPVAAVHVLAAGFWLGSLPPLLRSLRRYRPSDAGALLQRFSRIAVPAVTVLAAAGAALALQRLDSLGDLFVTDYGALVLAKIAGAALLVAIAAGNRFWLTPAIARVAGGATRRLRLAIAAELMLMAGVVAIAATLAHTDPHAGHGHRHRDAASAIALRLESGERVATVEIHPGTPGRNTLTVSFATRDGKPLAPLEASLELALPGARIEAFTLKLSPLAPGKFAAEIAELAVPGRWHLRIDALITDFEKAIFRGEVEIK